MRRTLLALLAVPLAVAACPRGRAGDLPVAPPVDGGGDTAPPTAPSLGAAPAEDASALDAAALEPADAADAAYNDAAALHQWTAEGLLGLVPTTNTGPKFMAYLVGPKVGQVNQGNPAIARHDVSKQRCLEGLRGVVLQTEEQRALCGAENMVPLYKGGDLSTVRACIDVFEYPNKACELPFVWSSPSAAEKVCELEGKRLCSQDEWNFACRGDPAGGKDSVYAYGDELDLTVCNTNKPHLMGPDGRNWVCWVKDAEMAFKTCGTDTEPSGAFPRCRSRFGVYDQHGNVAEEMSRAKDGVLYTQLKGSAFFYVDVARPHDKPHPKEALHDTYPDHCNYDPRWHVEKLGEAMHTNYHLGFRCCKSVSPRRGDAGP